MFGQLKSKVKTLSLKRLCAVLNLKLEVCLIYSFQRKFFQLDGISEIFLSFHFHFFYATGLFIGWLGLIINALILAGIIVLIFFIGIFGCKDVKHCDRGSKQ